MIFAADMVKVLHIMAYIGGAAMLLSTAFLLLVIRQEPVTKHLDKNAAIVSSFRQLFRNGPYLNYLLIQIATTMAVATWASWKAERKNKKKQNSLCARSGN